MCPCQIFVGKWNAGIFTRADSQGSDPKTRGQELNE